MITNALHTEIQHCYVALQPSPQRQASMHGRFQVSGCAVVTQFLHLVAMHGPNLGTYLPRNIYGCKIFSFKSYAYISLS